MSTGLECDPHAFSVTVMVDAGHYPGTYNGQTIAEIVAEIGDPFFAAALRLADPGGPAEEAVARELSTYLSIEGYEGQVLVDPDHVTVRYFGQGHAKRDITSLFLGHARPFGTIRGTITCLQ